MALLVVLLLGCQFLVSFLSYGPIGSPWRRPRLLPSAARVTLTLQTNRRVFKLLNGLGRPHILLSTGERLSLLFSRIGIPLGESSIGHELSARPTWSPGAHRVQEYAFSYHGPAELVESHDVY